MINNAILQGYLNCKYYPSSAFSGNIDSKREFEEMQDLILDNYKKRFNTHLIEKYGEDSIVDNFEFSGSLKKKRLTFSFGIKINKPEFNIIFDAIEIIKKSSKISYIPILFSINEKISKREKIFLAIQCLISSKLTGINFEFARIIYGKEFKTLKIEIQSYVLETNKILEELDKIIKDESGSVLPEGTICKPYEFEEWYRSKLAESDDIRLLSSIREKEKLRYEKKGIFTVNQLSYTFKPRKKNEWVKQKEHPFHHSLQALAIREKKVYVYDEVKIPNTKTKVFVDLEGNSDGSFIYLIGVLIKDENEEKFYSFWADNKENEKSIFKKFAELLVKLEEVSLFYYGKYDQKVFKRIFLSSRNKKVKETILNHSTDVFKSIRRNIYFPTYSNGLKDIAHFLGYNWSIKNSSGLQSIVWRWKWENNGDEKIKSDLIQYNKDDCFALKKVVEFLMETYNKILTKEPASINDNIFLARNVDTEKNRRFKDMTYANKDIEIINKSAYFHYQRDKIFFRTNKNLKKTNKVTTKKLRDYTKYNKRIIINADKCPFCKSKNLRANISDRYLKRCLDLKFFSFGIKRWITEYITFSYKCLKCRKKFIPRKFKKIYIYSRFKSITPSFNSLRRNQIGYGHNFLAWAMYQSVINKITFRNIEKNLLDYFDLYIDNRYLWGIKILASEYYLTTYQNIIKKMVRGNLIHADETKVKLKTHSGYIWVFTNMEEVIYLYKPTREADFLHEFLRLFNGVLITDFYSGYDSLECPQQKCLVHLMRDLNDYLLKNPFDEDIKEIVIKFGSILKNIIYTLDNRGLKKRYLHKHKKGVNRFFRNLKRKKFSSETANKIKKRLIDYKKELFLFLDYDNIPWNNNNAEYAIKYFADYRQSINKGSITENGLKAYLILLSIYITCKYKSINFLDFLLSKEKDIDLFMEKYKNKKYRSKIRQ